MAISFLTGESVDGNIALPDNKKIILGTGSDLEMYHDGSNSYIKDTGTGFLNISSDAALVLSNACRRTIFYWHVEWFSKAIL